MDSLPSVAGLLLVSAITPGPNNLIVLEAGAQRKALASILAIAGVVAGTFLLLALIWNGLDSAIRLFPLLGAALSIAGGLYLAWLGVSLLHSRAYDQATDSRRVLPTSVLGIATFQLLNPKAWVLVGTAAATFAGSGDFMTLAALMAVITIPCLALWALAGAALSRLLGQPRERRLFDIAMGGLLLVSAVGVIIDAFA